MGGALGVFLVLVVVDRLVPGCWMVTVEQGLRPLSVVPVGVSRLSVPVPVEERHRLEVYLEVSAAIRAIWRWIVARPNLGVATVEANFG